MGKFAERQGMRRRRRRLMKRKIERRWDGHQHTGDSRFPILWSQSLMGRWCKHGNVLTYVCMFMHFQTTFFVSCVYSQTLCIVYTKMFSKERPYTNSLQAFLVMSHRLLASSVATGGRGGPSAWRGRRGRRGGAWRGNLRRGSLGRRLPSRGVCGGRW